MAVCLALAGCGNLSSNVVSKPQDIDWGDVSDKTLPNLVETLAHPFIADKTNVGLVIGVLDGDDRKMFGFGRVSLASDEVPDGDTVFAIGSVTKAFLGLVTYELIEDGALALSDNLGSLLPENVTLSEAAKKITVEQLLTHSSGLPRQPNDLHMLASLINYSFTGENIYRHIDSEKIFEFLRTFDPDPNEVGAYRYSNIGSGILAKAIETKTGKSLATLLDDGILRRINAKDTTFNLKPEQASRLATGHVGDSPFFVRRNTPMAQWEMGDILSGAAALYSTGNDLLEFARYRIALGKGRIDVKPIHNGIFGVSSKELQKSSYGWMVDDFEDHDVQIIFQHGMISGYSTYVGIDPDRKIGVVVLSNNFNWDDYIGHSLILALAGRAPATQIQTLRED